MEFIGYSKWFLATTFNAPSSTHDARLVRRTDVFQSSISNAFPEKSINLGQKFGEIPLVTVGECAFPKYAWLVKGFSETTRNEKERPFNKKLR